MSKNSNLNILGYADTKTAIELLMRSNIMALVKSAPGHGKTSMIREIAEEKGPDYGLFEINCALANQPDFMGWFYRHTERFVDADGAETTLEMGKYTYPYFLVDKRTGRPASQYKRGAIVFEELGQADLDLKRALGQTMLEKRVGQHQLPMNFDIVGLSNRDTDRSGVTKDYDFLINRRGEINYQLGIDDFLVYGHRIGMQNMTMAFASMPVHQVFDGEVPKEQGPYLTPRSLEALDRLMAEAIASKTAVDDPIVRSAAAGVVGQGAAFQYIAFASLRDKIPSVSSIIRDPNGTPVPEKADQKMFLVFNMADAADKKNIDALVTYMRRLPQDMSVAFYRNALLRDKSLMSCKAFGDWAVANSTLLSIVNKK